MLIEFRVANFLSFEDMATLSMVATNDKEHENTNLISQHGTNSLLKSAAIYGANGAGKSNLIKALSFMQSLVVNSGPHSMRRVIPDHSFKLNLASLGKPSFFEVVFIVDNKRFRYGFEISKNQVTTEWLFSTPRTKEVMLFTRENNKVTVGASFKEARGLEGSLKKDYSHHLFLVLVSAANEAEVLADSILDWFSYNLRVTYGSAFKDNLEWTLHFLEGEAHSDEHYKEKFTSIFKKLDIFDRFELDEDETFSLTSYKSIEDEAARLFDAHEHQRIVIFRKKYDGDKYIGDAKFDLIRDESDGTKKLFAFVGTVVATLERGGVLVVDELELKLHPLLTRSIIQLFNSSSNSKGAQIIFTSHDTNLLSNRYFRRDQIWFVEKNKRGSSDLYSLVEYKPRKDATFHKDYILGKYGAIPFIGNIDALLGQDD
jgi:AAA15 family ATPase/GTPase